MENLVEHFREIALSGDELTIAKCLLRLLKDRAKYGAQLERDQCIRVLINPYEVTLFSELEILNPQS